MDKKKLTRAEIIAKAQAANAIPEGFSTIKLSMRLDDKKIAPYQKLSPTKRGETWSVGKYFTDNNYRVLYQIIYKLGGQIVYATDRSPFEFMMRSTESNTGIKMYMANDEFTALTNIIEDLIN